MILGTDDGWQAALVEHYVGERFLNKGNTALADSYTTVDASVAYHAADWDVQLSGENLTDERDPVAESELGDAQFYTLPGRSVWLRLSHRRLNSVSANERLLGFVLGAAVAGSFENEADNGGSSGASRARHIEPRGAGWSCMVALQPWSSGADRRHSDRRRGIGSRCDCGASQ